MSPEILSVGHLRHASSAGGVTASAAALDDLVRLLSPMLWQVVRATGLDREHRGGRRADDLADLRARRARRISEPRAVAGWLCTTARREAWRVSRQSTRTRPPTTTCIARRLPDEPAPEDQVVLDDENARLWEALGHLPERCQKLLRIVAAEARPDYSVVSQQLGMPVGSIGPTRGRCLDKLRRELAQAGGL